MLQWLDPRAAWTVAGGYALFCLLMIVPLWRACRRAGKAGEWSLLFAVPGIGPLLVLAALAFGAWHGPRGGAAE